MERRVSETVQPTGKVKDRKKCRFATVWLMKECHVVDGVSRFSFSRGSAAMGNQSWAEWASGEHFPEVVTRRLEGCSDLQKGR
jgi:hypothetical protein